MSIISDIFDGAEETASTPRVPRPGETFHAVRDGVVIPSASDSWGASGHVLQRGQNVTVTDALLDASRDRFGNLGGWAAVLYDDDAQVALWGHVAIAPGPFPETSERWEYGSPVWEIERDKARRVAWAIADDDARRAALADVEARFGPARSSSKTTAVYSAGGHPTEVAARQQEADFARDRAEARR